MSGAALRRLLGRRRKEIDAIVGDVFYTSGIAISNFRAFAKRLSFGSPRHHTARHFYFRIMTHENSDYA